jgi:hypothetical protein
MLTGARIEDVDAGRIEAVVIGGSAGGSRRSVSYCRRSPPDAGVS